RTRCMEEETPNRTAVAEFLLLGFSDVRELQILHFVLFLLIYLAALVGNLLIISAVALDHHLHAPMYFFLGNLSLLDIGSISVPVPKAMVNSLLNSRSISYAGCVAQVFFFMYFAVTEYSLLTVMAYDRYVAICQPLHYEQVMSRRACWQLAGASWFVGFPVAMVQTMWIFSLPFCGPNRVNHFFCDTPPLLQLACADTSLFEIEALSATVLFIMFPFLLILASYTLLNPIIYSLRNKEVKGALRRTLSRENVIWSGLESQSIEWGPKSSYSPDTKKLLSLSYTVVTPMLNPIIYSLRNKEVKGALRRTLSRKFSLQRM
uniref:Olfactory receptor n=1 Tax=Pelodiscus sinensis TaxID=13735 RepID=K7G3N5_PELSI